MLRLRSVPPLPAPHTTANPGTGMATGFSITMPAISLAPPKLAAKQWLAVYNSGILVAPPLALTAAAAFGYLSFRAGGFGSTAGGLLAGAGISAACFIPYTLTVMASTNGKLLDLGNGRVQEQTAAAELGEGETQPLLGEGQAGEMGEAHVLIGRWRALNFGRALWPATAAALGFAAIFPW
ncbi:hypothetical protein CALCODRAFT_497016 [Calocera cornea HHB12733]|uniref:DUF1772-domain-containing protein n=1 Tax=Calocera cornea HHB12733 TaxID=1353952 RepID=A0A165FGD6_9BASI|nr:hypothetical protein CALCODRAFT_497016 [Calocera cornea HHB12733]